MVCDNIPNKRHVPKKLTTKAVKFKLYENQIAIDVANIINFPHSKEKTYH